MNEQKEKNVNFGNVCTVHYAKIVITSLLFSFSAYAHDDFEDSKEYYDYEIRFSYCYKLSYREIDNVTDNYFNTLNMTQKKVIIDILSETAMNKCVAYEEAQFLKYVIRTQDKEALQFSKMISHKSNDINDDFSKALESLNEKEIIRLSNSDLFSTPFDRMSLLNNLERKNEAR